jgi:hypothetical protein
MTMEFITIKVSKKVTQRTFTNTEFISRCRSAIENCPEDVMDVYAGVLPLITAVFKSGAGSKPAGTWRKSYAAEHQVRAVRHDVRANKAINEIGPRISKDPEDELPDRAHQICRLMLALFMELDACGEPHPEPQLSLKEIDL